MYVKVLWGVFWTVNLSISLDLLRIDAYTEGQSQNHSKTNQQ